ncbi:MAG: LuxR C-terminal-related transcriptional regulator [Thermomicrobiales bacterium]
MSHPLPADVPPPITIESATSTLPSGGAAQSGLPLLPLIGRDHEVALLTDLLTRDQAQLVTLLGPGGVGKTRLAMHVAARIERDAVASEPIRALASGELPHVLVVPLAALTRPWHVVPALASQVGVGIDDPHDGPRRIVERFAATPHRVLVVMDNAEHLIEGMADLAPILLACPNLTMLVTSRTVLRLSMEQVFHLDPLASHPEAPRTGSPSPAAQLFIDRARAVHPAFQTTDANLAAIEDICARLDGLPLAIELAAARSRFFAPTVLRTRIEASSQSLGDGPRDAPTRHRSLRDLIAWSYTLLDEDEQTLFRRLAAFADGASISSLTDLTATLDSPDHPRVSRLEETIADLVDHSLIRIETTDDGEPRVAMLRTVRDAALEMLDASGERDATNAAITRHFRDIVRSLSPQANTIGSASGEDTTRLLHADRLNLLAAVSALVNAGEMTEAVAMVSSLAQYWLEAGQLREGRGWIERILPYAGDTAPQDILPLYRVVTILAFDLFDYEGAERYAREALEIERRDGNATMIAFRELMVGTIRFWKGEREAGLAIQAAGIARLEALNEPFRAALGMASHGECLLATGNLDAAEPLLEAAHATIAAQNPSLAGIYASALGTVAHRRGDTTRAGALFAESLTYHLQPPIRLQRNLIDRFLRIGALAASRGDVEAQARMAGSAAAVQDQLILGEVARQQENYREAMATRDILGPDAFQAAWETGYTRSVEASLRDALALSRREATTPSVAAPPPVTTPPLPAEPRPSPPAPRKAEAVPGMESLTPREREVLALLASGAANAEIADRLSLSPRTVSTHLSRIYDKLDITNRAEAVVLAIRSGIVANDQPT